MELNNEQQMAIDKAVNNKISWISGGAGCGKTTIIKEIAERLENPVLVAPTGKAAARLREASGLRSSTIHSKLGFIGDGFLGGALNGENWIVDESSMMDSRLMYEVVKRKPESITLVGDSAQLQPVGPGAPFFDIVHFYPELGQDLKICYRNKESIFQAAMEVRNGEMPGKHYESEGELWGIHSLKNAEASHTMILELVKDGKLDFNQDIVICCRNGDEKDPAPCTVHSLNRDIAEILLPREGDSKWRVGDRIICRKNFASKDIWNGTTGTITAVTYNGKGLYVRGDIPFLTQSGAQEEILWEGEVLKHSQLAYAITAHRSQGSQYRKVVFAINNNDFIMLTRSLIYTSITRAQKECHVIGSLSAFCSGINKIGDKMTAFKLIEAERRSQ